MWPLESMSAPPDFTLAWLRPCMKVLVSMPAFSVPPLTGPAARAALESSELAKGAAINLAKARAIAQKTRPGKITKEELEKEPGGSGLRYSFVIKNGSKLYEVGIDARSGLVLENIGEGRNPD